MKSQADQNKTSNRSKSRSGWAFFLTAVLTMLLPINNPIDLYARKDLPYQSGDRDMAMPAEKVSALNRADWFENPTFIRMVETHNQFMTEFARWRRLFARHAAEMAHLLKTFPGSENLREDELRRIISSAETRRDSINPYKVFNPWTNRWSGCWSNGSPQYHIWDSTRFVYGYWIQPVTLSETEFVDYRRMGKMLQSRKTDIAINVFRRDTGITGWVSKRQHGRVELPHIGYRVNATTLIWICQIKEPEKLFATDSRWFVFLETVHGSNDSAEYRIYGQPLVITDKISVDSSEPGKHYGTYYSADANNSSGS